MSDREAVIRLAAQVAALCGLVKMLAQDSLLNLDRSISDSADSIRVEAESIIRGEFGP